MRWVPSQFFRGTTRAHAVRWGDPFVRRKRSQRRLFAPGRKPSQPRIELSLGAPNRHRFGVLGVASDGGLFAFGAPFFGSAGATPINQPVVGMVTSSGHTVHMTHGPALFVGTDVGPATSKWGDLWLGDRPGTAS